MATRPVYQFQRVRLAGPFSIIYPSTLIKVNEHSRDLPHPLVHVKPDEVKLNHGKASPAFSDEKLV